MSEAKEMNDFWYNHAKNWETSGLTQREYCKREELSFNSFVYFRGLYLERHGKAVKSSFIDASPVTTTSSSASSALVMQVSLPTGVRIGLSANAPEQMIRAVITTIGG